MHQRQRQLQQVLQARAHATPVPGLWKQGSGYCLAAPRILRTAAARLRTQMAAFVSLESEAEIVLLLLLLLLLQLFLLRRWSGGGGCLPGTSLNAPSKRLRNAALRALRLSSLNLWHRLAAKLPLRDLGTSVRLPSLLASFRALPHLSLHSWSGGGELLMMQVRCCALVCLPQEELCPARGR